METAMKNNDQKRKQDSVFNANITTASLGLLGFKVKKLAPTKENFKKFQDQFNGHPICGCISCLELGKSFILSTPSIKEEVIAESMKDLKRK